MAHIILVGLNHKTADVRLREKLHFDKRVLGRALTELSRKKGIDECAILSTCNRVEVYAYSKELDSGFRRLENFLSTFHDVKPETFLNRVYRKSSEDAVEHLFSVASSLDSMVIGENQILGQVKEAYAMAKERRCTRLVFNRLFQNAISTGKKIRTDTDIGKGAVSIGSAAADLVKNIFPRGYAFSATLIGAGTIAELAARDLIRYGDVKLTVLNRTLQRSRSLAKKLGGEEKPYEERYAWTATSDVSIVSTQSPDYVLRRDELQEAFKNFRRRRASFLVDISVPRNIDPDIEKIDDVILYTIDDLKQIIEKNQLKRQEAVAKGREWIKESTENFFLWYHRREIIDRLEFLAAELARSNPGTKSTDRKEERDSETYRQWKNILFNLVVRMDDSRSLAEFKRLLIQTTGKIRR